jgi:MtN3 and saliva related transmembrane protein
MIDLIGYLASAASVSSFAPQAWKIIKTQDTSSVSKLMYMITVTGFVFWTIYGYLISSWPVIITNIICFLLSAFILAMKILPEQAKSHIASRIRQAFNAKKTAQ